MPVAHHDEGVVGWVKKRSRVRLSAGRLRIFHVADYESRAGKAIPCCSRSSFHSVAKSLGRENHMEIQAGKRVRHCGNGIVKQIGSRPAESRTLISLAT